VVIFSTRVLHAVAFGVAGALGLSIRAVALNSVIRAATKRRKVFPTDDSALKVVYLAIEQASRKWTMPIQNWKMALNRFVLEFGEQVTIHQP
jgi:hypothetical protein